ncbi:hypothetical protein BKA67DRAFT_561834 [Truncatella angustata]|uniref:Uncharacterized protein n=1 Tax=Truncatella angustata TaxID=152316 RepID=A0A9P8UP46_9PEZI|nr:uncharacterized protein BKA67DRAFT_561834 [Truncatella angustata]KAH6655772.1 hypothetical protein BKA67DRAFT_561834 [Truncatella angustata]
MTANYSLTTTKLAMEVELHLHQDGHVTRRSSNDLVELSGKTITVQSINDSGLRLDYDPVDQSGPKLPTCHSYVVPVYRQDQRRECCLFRPPNEWVRSVLSSTVTML